VNIRNNTYSIQLRIKDINTHQNFFIPSALGEMAMRIMGRKDTMNINIISADPIGPNITTSFPKGTF